VTRIKKIKSSLDEVKHADKRKVIEKSIIFSGKPQKHAGHSALHAFAAVQFTGPCGITGCGQYKLIRIYVRAEARIDFLLNQIFLGYGADKCGTRKAGRIFHAFANVCKGMNSYFSHAGSCRFRTVHWKMW
jgi:hypothetical protein